MQDVNKLLKMHRQMADMMKQMGRGKGMFARMGGMLGMGGGGRRDGPGGAGAARQERPAAGRARRPAAAGLGLPAGLPEASPARRAGCPVFRRSPKKK